MISISIDVASRHGTGEGVLRAVRGATSVDLIGFGRQTSQNVNQDSKTNKSSAYEVLINNKILFI